VLFVTEKTTDLDLYRVERTKFCGRELHPLKSSGFHGVLYRQLSAAISLLTLDARVYTPESGLFPHGRKPETRVCSRTCP